MNSRVDRGTDKVSTESASGELIVGGPRIPVTIAVPDVTRRAYEKRGSPVPKPVTGFALIDTGATQSCFDNSTAAKAGLPMLGESMMASASHPATAVPVYSGRMLLPSLNINVEAGLGVELASIDGLVALIGRDLLANAIFVYNGQEGTFSLAF